MKPELAIYILMLLSVNFLAYRAYRYELQLINGTQMIQFGKSAPLMKRNIYIFFSGTILFLVSALRYNVGTDYINYKMFIAQPVLPDWERGFVALLRLTEIFTDSYEAFIFVNSFLVVAIFCKCYYDYIGFHPMALYLFITMGTYFQSFCLLRQIIAIAILFYGFRYIKNKHYIKLILCIIVAALFHSSTLIVAPAFLLANIKIERKNYIFGTIFGGVIAIIMQPIAMEFINQKYFGAFNNAVDSILPIYSIALGMIVFVFAMIYRDKLIQLNESNNALFNIAFFYLVYTFVFAYVPVMSRCFQFFIPFFTLLIPKIIMCETNPVTRKFFYALFGIVFFIYMCLFVKFTSAGVLPYQTIIFSH
ncbi:EpsG family protein [Caproiciproducens sp. R2]|uniref:EpsG family protein n=1 Tax=Caproiciproducens sp. R2 TaxID=3435187 RepID=UPI004034812A